MTPQEIYIEVDSQELADELKEICLKYGLPIWEQETAFLYYNQFSNYFEFDKKRGVYWIFIGYQGKTTQITKEQFIELLDNINN